MPILAEIVLGLHCLCVTDGLRIDWSSYIVLQ